MLTWVSSPSLPLPPRSKPPHCLLTPSSVSQAVHFTNRTPAPALPTLLLCPHLPHPPLLWQWADLQIRTPIHPSLDVLSPTQALCSVRYPSPFSAFMFSLCYFQPTKENNTPTFKVKQKNLLLIFSLSLCYRPTSCPPLSSSEQGSYFSSHHIWLAHLISLFKHRVSVLLLSSASSKAWNSLGMQIRHHHSPAQHPREARVHLHPFQAATEDALTHHCFSSFITHHSSSLLTLPSGNFTV